VKLGLRRPRTDVDEAPTASPGPIVAPADNGTDSAAESRQRPPAPLEPTWAVLFGLSNTPSWRRWGAVTLVFLTVLVEISAFTEQVSFLRFGAIQASLSIVPALLLAAFLGRTIVGRQGNHDAFVTFWACAVVILSVAVIGFSRLDHPIELAGLVLVSVDEELVYRLALPVLLAAALVGFGLPRKWCRILGYTIAGIAWVLLPGHRAQMHNPAEVFTFIEFAFLMAVICLRSGSVLATATAHVCSNLLTVLVWREVLPQSDRSLMFGGLLALMLLAYGMRIRNPRSGSDGADGPHDVEEMVIDLRVPPGDGPPHYG
jgi:hypothetical protein